MNSHSSRVVEAFEPILLSVLFSHLKFETFEHNFSLWCVSFANERVLNNLFLRRIDSSVYSLDRLHPLAFSCSQSGISARVLGQARAADHPRQERLCQDLRAHQGLLPHRQCEHPFNLLFFSVLHCINVCFLPDFNVRFDYQVPPGAEPQDFFSKNERIALSKANKGRIPGS